MFINHQTHHHPSSDLQAYPHFMRMEHRQFFASHFGDCQVLWVYHPLSRIWWPWLATEDDVRLARIIRAGAVPSPAEIHRAKLLGLLVAPLTELDVTEPRGHFKINGWCKTPPLVWPTYHDTVDFYMSRVGNQLPGDTQVEGRLAQHNSPLFAHAHAQLATLASQLIGHSVKPSYCYLGHYPAGSKLIRHTDRPQCAYNMSICFSRRYNTQRAESWPIFVEANGTTTSIEAEEGEGIFYSGTDIPHWRDPLPNGTATVCFYHFVPSDFVGGLD